MALHARALVAATTTGMALGAALLTTAAASATSAPAPAAAAPPARVYVSLPRQGKAAPSAALIARGLRAATAIRDGRAGGRRIKLVWLDDATGDRWDPAKVVANAQRAAADPTAIAYVGEGNSEATALSMPIVNRAGLAQLSPVSTASSLTDPERATELQPTGAQTFFRPLPDDARQGAALVAYARSSGVTDRVLLVDDDGLYGHGLTSAFAAEAARGDVGVLGRRVVTADGAGLEALAHDVRARKPRAVVYGGSPSSDAAAVVRALHAASPDTLIFGGDALANDPFAQSIGAAQSVMRLTTPAAHANPRSTTTGLGRRPAPFTVFAHNGMTALLRAVDRAAGTGAVTRESVRTAVFDGSVQTGLSGAWKLTAVGDSNYGVFDELRLVGGRVQTPGELAVERLVRKQSAALRRRLAKKESAAARTGRTLTKAQASVGSMPSAATLGSLDLEAAMRQVQADRNALLDQQLADQAALVQESQKQVTRLQTVGSLLATIESAFPAGAAAGTPTSGVALPANTAADLGRAVTAASIAPLDTATLGQVRDSRTRVRGLTDAKSNALQMDMLRLQSLTNKRNEAFDTMTNFMKKMADSRASILANMRG